MKVALPNTVRHHGVCITPHMVVRTMRGQRKPNDNSPDWIEYVPPRKTKEQRHG